MRKTAGLLAVLAFSGPLSAAVPSRPNVILVVIDALAKSHLQSFGYARETSPFLRELFRHSVVLSDAVAASSHTAPSVASILTGKYPYRHGVQYFHDRKSFHPTVPLKNGGFPRLDAGQTLLVEMAKRAGYRTLVYQTNPWLRTEYGFAQGADHYRFISDNDGSAVVRSFAEDALRKPGKESFFAYLHLMDVHSPYYKPATFKGLFTPYRGEPVHDNEAFSWLSRESVSYAIDLYDEGVAHADGVLRDLFARLEKSGRLRNTLVVIVADHGEEFLQHGGLGHGRTCYNEVKDSFIVFSHSGLEPKIIADRVSLVDIFPTLLEWMRIRYREDAVDGRSLRPLVERGRKMRERTIFSELGEVKAILDGGREFICRVASDAWEIYDLLTDREEAHPAPAASVPVFASIREILRRIIREGEAAIRNSTAGEEEIRRLKSLGYIK